MKDVTFSQRMRYTFDNLMSKGTTAPIILLFAAAFTIIILLAVILLFSGFMPVENYEILGIKNPDNVNLLDVIWVLILRALDGGVISEDPIYVPYLVFMFISTLGGIFLLSILISIVNSGVTRKLSDLRKGKSFVVEEHHTVILGWSFQVFQIISELVIANENQRGLSIAVLAEKDKVEMEDEIRSKIKDFKGTRIVCRRGNPIDLNDLEIINVHKARSIIILAPESSDPDSMVIKIILAITNNPQRMPLPHKYHIVAEVRDPKNVGIAKIAGKDEVQLVIFDHVISRITAQTCRQPGLSVVFTELLDFEGDEVYFQEEKRMAGKTFVEVLFSYETSTIIGIRHRDGRIELKPKMDSMLEEGDLLIAISEDDDTVIPSGMTEFGIDPGAIRKSPKYMPPKPEKTLILGWNRRAPLIINELDLYVWHGSKITVVSNHPDAEKELSLKCSDLEHQTVSFWQGDTTNRAILDDLNVEDYDHIIVLGQTELTDVQSTDAKTLNTLLHLRDIADTKGHTFSIVSEMLDDRNRQLAEITHADDFIVSVKLDSLMLSQISENRELKTVFETLFSAGGPSIFLNPAEHYVEPGRPVNFYTIMESARQQNQIAIGYKLAKPRKKRFEGEKMLAYGVNVNPKKSNQVFFSEGDKIIVLGEDDSMRY